MRLRKKGWIAQAIKEYAAILPDPFDGKWREAFAADRPLYVEIGTGRGRFINELAALNPQINFVGIEAQRDIVYFAAQKVADRQLSNLKLFLCNAADITNIFAPGEVSRLYINFCDPWHKNRHAKRRLTHHSFLEKYRRILATGGELFFKTDNEKLFEFSLNEFAGFNLKLRKIAFDLHSTDDGSNIMTEYEMKFSAKGMKIYRCEAIF